MMLQKALPRRAQPRSALCAALAVACLACAPDDTHDEATEATPAPTSLRAETGQARSGSWVGKASLSSSPSWTKLNHYDSKVMKKADYVASIWVRGSGKLRLDVVNGAWRANLGSVSITATSSWQKFTVPTFNSGDNDVVHFSVYDAVGGSAGTVYVDDAFLGQANGSNLLENPSFEAGAKSWLPDGIFSVVQLSGGGGSSSQDPAPSSGGSARTGKGYAQAKIGAGETWTKLIHHDTPVAKNRTYSASIWARGKGRLRFDIVNKAWRSNLASVVIDATQSWQRYTVPSFDTGDNDVIHFSLYDAVGDGAGTVYFDDAFLGLVNGANLLANPGFEEGASSWIAEGVFSVARGGSTSNPDPGPAPSWPEETKPDPDGTYFAEVDANGTGCPKDTWNTRISSDGLVFTTTFNAYEVRLDPANNVSVKDCQLAIRLHTPQGRSFSVQTFSYSGYAFLKPGVTGRQLASYSFQGQPVQSQAARTDLNGPYDDPFVFVDEVPIHDAIWSPCGLERELNITTRLLLQSERAGPSGYMNMTSADGSAKLILKLASRSCSEFGSLR